MLFRIADPMRDYQWATKTPGEEAHFNHNYFLQSTAFCQANEISNPDRFIKVRIVKESGRFNIEGAWWKESVWQDRTFWCYQTPVKLFHKDSTTPYLCYALELFECSRVNVWEYDKYGKSRFAPGDSLIVPCDCCEQCWDETIGGVSEHVRDRPNLEDVSNPLNQPDHLKTEDKILNFKTSEEREKEQELTEKAAVIEKQIRDVEDDPGWSKEVDGPLH